MTNAASQLRVAVRGDEIIVTLPGYTYSVTYYKPEGSHGLLAKDMTAANDLRIPMTAAEFLTQAWKRANDKARELGWIV
jgi:hypothetical protein